MTSYREFNWNRARSDFFTFFTDFLGHVAADWTITAVGAGTAAQVNTPGGALLLTNAAADNDRLALQWAGGTAGTKEQFKFVRGKKLQFAIRAQLSDVSASDFFAGLYITDTDPEGGLTDGIYFRKLNGSTQMTIVVEKDSVETVGNVAINLVNATDFTLEFYYDGSNDKLQVFANGVRAGSVSLAGAPDDEELSVSFALQNGAAVAKTATVDFIGASQQR